MVAYTQLLLRLVVRRNLTTHTFPFAVTVKRISRHCGWNLERVSERDGERQRERETVERERADDRERERQTCRELESET